MLVSTLVLIGVATVLIGLLPGYATHRGAAPIVLVLLRFAQGVGVGGEWGGAVLLSSEYGDPKKRGFWASAAQIGPPAGNLMANGALAVLAAALTEEQFVSWGWRVAFLISARAGRLRAVDPAQARGHPGVPRASRRAVNGPRRRSRRSSPPRSARCSPPRLARVGPDVLYALFTVFVATYATTELGMSRSQVLTAVLIGRRSSWS